MSNLKTRHERTPSSERWTLPLETRLE